LQYKNQQREIQFQLKRASQRSPINVPEDRILTIDQCQGQEADVVIFSLVQRPTRFLTKNRLNVALSRTKKELIILGDRNDFRNASQNEGWDCKFLAQDILSKTGTGTAAFF
jgi:superfamily I DNA and/or RNA helicase